MGDVRAKMKDGHRANPRQTCYGTLLPWLASTRRVPPSRSRNFFFFFCFCLLFCVNNNCGGGLGMGVGGGGGGVCVQNGKNANPR